MGFQNLCYKRSRPTLVTFAWPRNFILSLSIPTLNWVLADALDVHGREKGGMGCLGWSPVTLETGRQKSRDACVTQFPDRITPDAIERGSYSS